MLLNRKQTRLFVGAVSASTLRDWQAKRGFPRPIYIANRPYFVAADVMAWIQARRADTSETASRLAAQAARIKGKGGRKPASTATPEAATTRGS